MTRRSDRQLNCKAPKAWNGLGANQIGFKIGFVVAGADIAHYTMQIAEIVAPQHTMLGSEREMTRQVPLIHFTQKARCPPHWNNTLSSLIQRLTPFQSRI